ncbi:unnamed protein product, partial [Staurois parvus]
MIGTIPVSNQLYGQQAEAPAVFSGPPMVRDCPRRPWRAAGGGGHNIPLLVKVILQTSSWYNHSKSSDVPVRRCSWLWIYAMFLRFFLYAACGLN